MAARPTNQTTDELLYVAYMNGISVARLAKDLGKSERTIQRRIAKGEDTFAARIDIPRLSWLTEHTPNVCPHDRPIALGDAIGCLTCLQTGYDECAGLWSQRLPDDAKLPELPKPKLTRRQRRAAYFSRAS